MLLNANKNLLKC